MRLRVSIFIYHNPLKILILFLVLRVDMMIMAADITWFVAIVCIARNCPRSAAIAAACLPQHNNDRIVNIKRRRAVQQECSVSGTIIYFALNTPHVDVRARAVLSTI
jgi:hypothetical protein